MSNKYQWPINPHSRDRAQDLQDERIDMGMFRCDRCGCLMPLPVKWEDGHKICRRCADALTPLEAQMSMAEERAANAVPYDTLPYPVFGAFDGAVMITGVSPKTLNLTRGGSSGSIAITGVNLSASDTWAGSDTHITVTPTVNSTTSVTLACSASGTATRANYSITFNGDTITPRGILKVR